MKNYCPALTLLALLSLSCAKDHYQSEILHSDSVTVITVDPTVKSPLVVSELVQDFKYIKLETNDKCLIGRIDRIRYFNDRFYVLDAYKAKALFMFDNEGRFIRQIGTRGKGEGEYLRIQDFVISEKTNELLVLDRDGQKIMIFTPGGDFKTSGRYGFWASNIFFQQDNVIIYPGNSVNVRATGYDFQLIYVNRAGEVISKVAPMPEYALGYSAVNVNAFTGYGGDNYFIPTPGNTVYRIIDNGITPHYTIDFGEYNASEEVYKKNSRLSSLMDQENVAFNLQNFFETKHYITFQYLFNKKSYFVFWNKESKKLINSTGISDDLALAGYFTPIATVNDDWMLASVDAHQLKTFVDKAPQKYHDQVIVKNVALMKITKEIQPVDNPILLLFKLKQ